MKMKRVNVRILILLIIMAVNFCGCSKSTVLDDSVRLRYYAYFEDSICDIIKKYNRYCEKNLDESYQIEIVEFASQEEMNLRMSTEIMSGGGPDIFSLSQKLPYEKLADNKALLDINKLIDICDYDIGLENCNSTIMDGGVIGGKRYFIPLFYSPNVFLTTEETLKKYNLSSSAFSYKALSDELLNSRATYSLFGSTDDNISFFYSFLDQYIDYNNGNAEFDTDEFSENLDCIYNLIKNDTTDENTYYFLYENINNGASVLYREMLSFDFIVRTYSFLEYLGGTPVLVNNYKKGNDLLSASIDVGMAVNNNCKNKEKLLSFIKYGLSYDIQKYMSDEYAYLPVNRKAMDYFVDSTDEKIDFDDDLSISDNEKTVFIRARSAAIKDYKHIINNISECNLYSFNCLSETYFNSSVIGEIVDEYLNGDISKDKFIRELSAATEIYLNE